MSTSKVCDICRQPDPTTRRFGLAHQYRDPVIKGPDGRGMAHRNRHYGGIDLCLRCWERVAKPKMRGKVLPIGNGGWRDA